MPSSAYRPARVELCSQTATGKNPGSDGGPFVHLPYGFPSVTSWPGAAVVRRDDLDTAGLQIESLSLVAALPGGGAAVQTGLRGMLRDTLSNRAANEPAVLVDSTGTRRFVIRVTRDFKGDDGRPCRAYTITRAGGTDGRREFPGVSCYDDAKKQWRVPGL